MTKTYTRRTPEQMIADLEAKIEAVKARATAREAKAAPDARCFGGMTVPAGSIPVTYSSATPDGVAWCYLVDA